MAEWKMNNWLMKVCFILGAIAGIIVLISFVVGLITGMMGVT